MVDIISDTLVKSKLITTAKQVTTQAFDSSGIPIPPIDLDLQKVSNIAKAFSGQIPSVQGSQTTESIVTNIDTAALKQKGYFQEKGFFGDQSVDNSSTAFGNAAQNAASYLPSAKSIASITQSSKGTATRNKVSNYFLYDREKALLQRRAAEFAAFGVVPYDVLEEFLYILVSLPNYEDLQLISKIVGIEELDDRRMVREPEMILNITTLYKVGYLANGVAAITKMFDPKFDVLSASDSDSSNYGAALGALAAGIALTNLPIMDTISDLVGDIVGQVGGALSLASGFGSFSGLGSLGGLTNLAGQLSNITSSLLDTSSIINGAGIASMMPAVGILGSAARQANYIAYQTQHLASISQVASSAKTPDVANQMAKISQKISAMSSLMSAASSLISGAGMPSISPAAAGLLVNKLGGQAPSGIIMELTMGQRLPPSVLYKNPMMMSPSYSGKAFFGEMPSPMGAIDQVFCKKIASFPQPNNGGGNMSFGMQNYSSFGQPNLTLLNMVSKIMLGTTLVPTSGVLSSTILSKAIQVADILNVHVNDVIEPRRSDNSIPFMLGMGAALVDDTKSPYSSSVYSDSWKLASSVGNEVQRYQPQFLETCKTSL